MKRTLDFVGAATLLMVLAPILAVVALSIKIDSRGPLFYRSRRVGRFGREFDMIKFRKMRASAEGPALTSATDDRFTRVGAFLARTKLDELPQLWNVIRGDMSLVGPRPEDPRFVSVYPDQFALVLVARPGITGLSQIAFAEEGRVLDRQLDPMTRYIERLLPQKLALDRLYVASRSLRVDVRILVWTIITVVLSVDVSVDRDTGRLTVRRRPNVPSEVSGRALATEDVHS